MTLADIARGLPGTLHDAALLSLAIDYRSRRAALGLSVDVSDPDPMTPTEGEVYQPATLIVSELVWCIVEPPGSSSVGTGELWIDAGLVSELPQSPPLPPVPDGAFVWWIFVQQWNSFIYLAGRHFSIG